MFSSKKPARNSERGIALIIALLSLLLISVIALGMMTNANTEDSISSNFRDEQVAFFSARGGLDEVRDRLRGVAPNNLTVPLQQLTGLPGAANGVLYVTDGTSQPWLTNGPYPDTELCVELNVQAPCPLPQSDYVNPPATASPAYAAAPALPWRWVRVTMKADNSTYPVDGNPSATPICWSQTNEATPAPAPSCDPVNNPQVYMLTAEGVTTNGSRRLVQYEVARTAIPPMPGAMVFDGPNPVYNAPNSNAFNVSGIDQHQGPAGGGCTTRKTDKAALGGFNQAAKDTLWNDVINNRPQSYTGSSGANPDVQNVNSALKNLTTVDGLQALVSTITTIADKVWPSNPTIINLGTPQTPMINVVQGDYTLNGGTTGTGILLVSGNLTLNGNPNFNGLILVIGNGSVLKNGGGNGILNGSLFVANLHDSSGGLIPTGASPPNPPGVPSVTWGGGGTATIQYDSCWIQDLGQRVPYRILAVREVVN